MGILRADRITGLGGANAIKGSVFFPQNSYINVEPDSDLDLSGDFTVEMWVYNLPGPAILNYQRQISSKGYYTAGNDGNWYFGFNQNSSYNILFYSYDGTGSAEFVTGTCTSNLDEWYHIAASRSGSTLKLFVNGVEEASGTLSKGLDDGGNNGLFIGGISSTLGTDSYGDHYGYTSNIRIIKGRALYTAAFTPPAFELNQTSDTTLLCCQSSGNVLQEKTGKILSINNHYGNTNSQGVIATRFTPNSPVGFSTTTDVGSQYGSTFDGFGSFATSTYMVPPGGNTRERNRGRAVFMGGTQTPNTPKIMDTIDYVEITTSGVGVRFGSLTTTNCQSAAFASSTRGINAGGQTSAPGDNQTNIIEFVTIATEGNGTNFGDLDTTHRRLGGTGHSSQTRGIIAGGSGDSPGETNVIQYVTIASLGDATNFGDLLNPKDNFMSKNGSSTRMLMCGGRDYTPSATATNVIEYLTIATLGDSQNFGDLFQTRFAGTGCGSATRGVIAGGQTPTYVNTIDYVTIASTANATDFGDLTATNSFLGGASNSIKGIFAGGQTPTKLSTIQSIDIASTGNAVAFGDNTATNPVTSRGTCSDSHGGLS